MSSYPERKQRWAEKMKARRSAVDTARSADRLPPGQHLTTGFPVLDLGIHPKFDPAHWSLEITGHVENALTLDWDQFNALPQTESVSDFHCVTTWSKYECRWSGVALSEIIDRVRPLEAAAFVFYTAYDGYTVNTRLADLLDDDVLLASRFDGKPLTAEAQIQFNLRCMGDPLNPKLQFKALLIHRLQKS